jgi:hypothetical protein
MPINNNKMSTIEQRAAGVFDWDENNQARIERNLFTLDGETWEALRFCKHRNGRHNRVHLVIGEADFVELFRNAVRNGVFHQETLDQLRAVLEQRRDPFLDVIGIGEDGRLARGIDEELYGEKPV